MIRLPGTGTKKVYLPVVSVVESSGLHDEFPHLSLTDLYLLVLDKQHNLQEWLGTALRTENIVEYLADQEGKQTKTAKLTTDISPKKKNSGIFWWRSVSRIRNRSLEAGGFVNRSRKGNILASM